MLNNISIYAFLINSSPFNFRMVYLDKLMTRDIIVEKKKKEREKYIRLRTKGKWKPPTDSDGDKSDEFTYEYFSRFSGFNEGAQGMEEISKPKTPEDAKPRPADTKENQQVSKTLAPPPTHKNKRLRTRKKLRRKKKKKKKSKKCKLHKRKPLAKSKVDQRIKKFRSLIASSRNKPKKSNTSAVSKKKILTPATKTKKKPDSNKTLIQMLKTSEQQDKKKSESNLKSKSPDQPKQTDD